MPVMEAVLEQSYFGQQIINRFNYIGSGTPAAVSMSFALATALGAIETAGVYPGGGLMDNISECQVEDLDFVQLTVRDVYSFTDFYEVPFIVPLAGKLVGTAMSPISNLGFRSNRTRLDIRRGTKRFVGLTEEVVTTGGVLTPSFLAGAVNDLAGTLAEPLLYDDEGNDLTFLPCIVSKEKYSTNPPDDTKFAYRYYPTEVEQLEHIMSSIVWDAYGEVRSQTSRQYGKGR